MTQSWLSEISTGNLLPHDFDESQYWQTVYARPLPQWQPALEIIRERHHLTTGEWERFTLGRNAVFGMGPVVVKLGPPFWSDEIPRESDALQFVHHRLPLAVGTPELIATGTLEAWSYLVQSRLPGEQLRAIWPTLDLSEKILLARQHGELMAAVHSLPVHDAPASLAFDWSGMLTEQRMECVSLMRNSGVQETLFDDLVSYLDQAQPLLDADRDQVLVHGDLDAVNLMVEMRNSHWRISGLVDWGDVKLGPLAHEFISPRCHMYRHAYESVPSWYAGYGLRPDQHTEQFEHNLMARSMLYYAAGFGAILGAIRDVNQLQSWSEIASQYWSISSGALRNV